ncbi:unnamed protein product [Cuscuta campestris]|uniref:Uncharacterized protein n=1 Tax=Cuscuta campestris TaxID=132261 RepID=A0A484KTR3_9ASTE|nr:unnamed protein product [Cuscuta campestris]
MNNRRWTDKRKTSWTSDWQAGDRRTDGNLGDRREFGRFNWIPDQDDEQEQYPQLDFPILDGLWTDELSGDPNKL